MIDAHIHLDHYKDNEIELITGYTPVEAFISVSFDWKSSERNLELSRKYPEVKPAFGYHPEQALPTESQISELLGWMENHSNEMIAIGEVGLPYYSKLEHKVSRSQYGQYLDLLEAFIKMAKRFDKPVLLHAIYDDAPAACDLLEKYSITRAHFHWFKGDIRIMDRMMDNGYFISVTPDIVYEKEIRQIVSYYPTDRMMIETDGPWPFEGKFSGKMTHPEMMLESIKAIAAIKGLNEEAIRKQLLQNTRTFFKLT